MNADEKAAFVAKVRRAQADAARRGLRVVGYEVNGDHVRFLHEPVKPTKSETRKAPPPQVARIRRGGMPQQDFLL